MKTLLEYLVKGKFKSETTFSYNEAEKIIQKEIDLLSNKKLPKFINIIFKTCANDTTNKFSIKGNNIYWDNKEIIDIKTVISIIKDNKNDIINDAKEYMNENNTTVDNAIYYSLSWLFDSGWESIININ